MRKIADPVRCLALAVLAQAIQDLSRSGQPSEPPQPVSSPSPSLPAGAGSPSGQSSVSDSHAAATPFDGDYTSDRVPSHAVSRHVRNRYARSADRWLLEDSEMVQAWCRLAGISARRYYRAACEKMRKSGHPSSCVETVLDSEPKTVISRI